MSKITQVSDLNQLIDNLSIKFEWEIKHFNNLITKLESDKIKFPNFPNYNNYW